MALKLNEIREQRVVLNPTKHRFWREYTLSSTLSSRGSRDDPAAPSPTTETMSSSQPFLASSPLSQTRRKSRFTYKDLAQLKRSSTTCPLRVVALIDLDAFYAQCEMVRLSLPEDQPLAVQVSSTQMKNHWAELTTIIAMVRSDSRQLSS